MTKHYPQTNFLRPWIPARRLRLSKAPLQSTLEPLASAVYSFDSLRLPLKPQVRNNKSTGQLSLHTATLETSAVSVMPGLPVSVMPGLPVELLLQILENVGDSRDLCSVRLTCKLLGDIAALLLYRKVTVPLFGRKRLDFARQTKLYQAIQSPRILSYVTVALLSLGRWNSCPKFDMKGMMPYSLRRCSCNQLDHRLGLALQVLPNLQVLHLHCYLCRDQDSGRHRYLAQLSTTNLRQLSFACVCMEKGSQVLASQMLQSNAMATLKTLGLEWISVQPEEPVDPSLGAHLLGPHSLPQLTSLQHDGSQLATSILSTRPVSRLAYQRTGSLTRRREDMLRVHKRVFLHQDTLTYLFVDDVAPFIHDMIASAQYYRRLKYLGSFKHTGSSVCGFVQSP